MRQSFPAHPDPPLSSRKGRKGRQRVETEYADAGLGDGVEVLVPAVVGVDDLRVDAAGG